MKIEIQLQRAGSVGTVEAVVSHKEEEVRFGVSLYTRKPFTKDFDVFREINQYWASLDEKTQDEIFELYKKIYSAMHDIVAGFFGDSLFNTINDLVKQFLRADGPHSIESVRNWMIFKSDIIIPDDVDEEYVHNIDKNTSREKTYIRSDYMDLVAASIIFRAMIPIWGEFVYLTRKEVGNDFKEEMAFKLMEGTPLMESKAMEKLLTYIEHLVGDDNENPAFILKGISSEKFCPWLRALICVRRLSISDISGLPGTSNLATVAYTFILNKIYNPGGSFKDRYMPKKDEDGGPEGESKISTIERYRKRTDISVGEKMKLIFSVKDPYRVLNRITTIVTEDDLRKTLETSEELVTKHITPAQINLARWVLKPAISPKGLSYVPEDMRAKLLGVVEAALWAQGHEYLAILVSSYVNVSDGVVIASGADSRRRVPQELMEKFDEVFPYHRVIESRRGVVETKHHVLEAVDEFVNEVSSYSWRATASDDKLMKVFGNTNRNIPIKPDIKTDIITLIIELGQRSWY